MNDVSRCASSMRTGLSLFLALTVFFGMLTALYSVDFHVIRFVRSLHDPTIEHIGNFGNRLGHGVTLVLTSIGLLAVGYTWKHDRLRHAGIDSLLAHAVVGLAVQIPKHLIGRPRPRFMHQGNVELGPSWQGGLDAFPSGHASASFAVAAVLTRYYPQAAWIWYGAAVFVALSRVVRGSHFLTDVMAGAMLGYMVGYIMARPLRDWQKNCVNAVVIGLPTFVAGFALMWVTVQREQLETVGLALNLVISGSLLLGGLWFRWKVVGGMPTGPYLKKTGLPEANLLLGMSLAISTGSLLVMALACATGLAWWTMHHQIFMKENGASRAHEIILACSMVGLFVFLQTLRGLIPLI